MSISSEITRIKGNIANAYTAINNKGGTLPTTQNSANLATAINSITGGSSKIYTSVVDMNDDLNNVPNGIYGIIEDTNFQAIYHKVNGAWVLVGEQIEYLETFENLSNVIGTEDDYEGLGGTEVEVEEILTEVIEGGNE